MYTNLKEELSVRKCAYCQSELGFKPVDRSGAVECSKCNQWSKMRFKSSLRIGVALSAISALVLWALGMPEWWSFIWLGIMMLFANRLAPLGRGGEPRELWKDAMAAATLATLVARIMGFL